MVRLQAGSPYGSRIVTYRISTDQWGDCGRPAYPIKKELYTPSFLKSPQIQIPDFVRSNPMSISKPEL